jgi:HK97 family phage major capsid protein
MRKFLMQAAEGFLGTGAEIEEKVLKGYIDEALTARLAQMQLANPELPNVSGEVITKAYDIANRTPTPKKKEKVMKTFNFLQALALNNGAALEAMQKEYEAVYKALDPNTEGTDTDGGYLVPPEFASDLIVFIEEYGYARQFCNVISMKSNVLNASKLTAKPTVAWVTEFGAIADSKGTFGRLTLTAQKLATIYPVTNELLADANIDIYAHIMAVLGEAFALAEDKAVFRDTTGFGAGVPLLTQTTAVWNLGGSTTSGKLAYADIEFDDLLGAINELSPSQRRGASFFFDQNTVNVLRGKKDSTGRYMIDQTTSMVDGKLQTLYSFMGYPIVEMPETILIETYDADDHVSTKFALFGNLKTAACWFGTRGGMQTRISSEATVDGYSAFERDLQLMRMIERIAFGVGLPLQIVAFKTAAS